MSAKGIIVTRDVEAREALRSRLIKLSIAMPSKHEGNVSRIENGPPPRLPCNTVFREDADTLRKPATQVADIMRTNAELSNINFDWRELSKAIEIEIDQDKHVCSVSPVRT